MRDIKFTIELLADYGIINQEQVDEAQRRSDESDGAMDIIDALVLMGVTSETDIQNMLAQQFGLEVMDLSAYQVPPEVVESLPRDVVLSYGVVPVMKNDNVLTIAMSDPTNMEAVDSIRYLLGCDVEAVIAKEEQINDIINKHYNTINDSVSEVLAQYQEEKSLFDVGGIGDIEETSADDSPIIKLVSLVIMEAFKLRASDIHWEPLENRYRIRCRVDGVLQEMDSPPKYIQSNLTSRIKIMSRMNIAEKRIPQDGRIQIRVMDKDVDLRVSSIPTTNGESIVMRILDKSSIQLEISQLGFYPDDTKIIERILGLPDGIFLVTGPTGSGKTTSLYAFLNTINTPQRKIITAEDPIEYQLSGINQVQVDRHVNLTFAAALRSMLRQAPNIIMVGEIRDLETAEISINAALTGHLVFSTLHTNDAPGAVSRMVDMGVKCFMIASSLRAVMAQRLVRRLCKFCKEDYTLNERELRLLGLTAEYAETRTYYKGTGCPACTRGYKGRMGVYEILNINAEITEMIFQNQPSSVLREAGRRNGMHGLREDALRKAEDGSTSIEEVIRVTMIEEEQT
ncbi:MAG: ATPase, T2SS/T4P/T4SS family [Victivallaceae bacterium]|nr:ATPase, T2SS/T4P/T4SS family [Victivallaceae bacterium]MDD4180248.1 ATPase, T2SS/T4P/T4SS family [Victivallaceae bacterium]